MAITIIKQPAQFFNCTSPAIFEFTTDSTVGNFDDYVCDVVITSAWANKTAVIRNVFPSTQTKIFTVDASEFFKALQLNGFEFDFNGSKNFAVEKFTTSLKIRDGSVPDDTIYSFDNYTFDNFVFTDGLGAIDDVEVDFYSILGERLLFDSFVNPIVANKLTFLTPAVIEVYEGFDNYLSIFVNESTGNTVSVGGVTSAISNVDGVATYKLTDEQVGVVKSLIPVTCSNQNPAKSLKAFNFRADCAATVVQFRFFNNRGGFSYFYANVDTSNSDRSKVTFYDRGFSNENENKSPAAQSGGDYKSEITFKGSKILDLHELFDMLLRSPKVEMNLKQLNGNDLFVECEVTGSAAKQALVFDFTLKAKITNSGNFKL
jgi:hypothetical protein